MSTALAYPAVREDGDKLYLVAPVTPFDPTGAQVEEYAYSKAVMDELKGKAPNDHLAWFTGHYVEADKPNLNGAMWLSNELAIASLTPMLMPVTIMHDPRTAVGLIADLALRTPANDNVPRNKIDTVLALWSHRFPEAVEEARANYAQGTLMQSMECLAPQYSCSVCGMLYHKLPGGVEQANWCEHLKASQPSGGYNASADVETPTAVRILRSVVFTGTGLIFGTQGAQGADPSALLEEVAEFHEKARQDKTYRPKEPTPVMSETVTKSEFDRVVAERDAAIAERDAAKGEVAELKTKVETTEAAKVAAESERDDFKGKVEAAEETARKTTLADERMNRLGEGFVAKLGEATKTHLREDAAELDDAAWDKRLTSVEELAKVKRDAPKEEGDGDGDGEGNGEGAGAGAAANGNGSGEGTFNREEVARSAVGGAGHSNGAKDQTPATRQSVVGGLAKTLSS